MRKALTALMLLSPALSNAHVGSDHDVLHALEHGFIAVAVAMGVSFAGGWLMGFLKCRIRR